MKRLLLLPLAALLAAGGRASPPPVIAVAGDLSLARGVAGAHRGAWTGTLRAVQAALNADARAANLESPLTDRPRVTGGLDLRAPPGAAAALRPFTHLGVENNHARDAGPAGQRQTRQALRAAGLTPVTRSATFTRVAGRTVAWIAFLDDGGPLPLPAVRAAAHRAPTVVVLAHWGEEYGLTTARQRQQARALVTAGAALIAGSGPHVLQGHEVLPGPRGPALVLYSLGNLLFDQPYPAAQLGAVVRVPLLNPPGACAVPTLTRAARVTLARGEARRVALTRLNLPACPGSP
ncbi:CapA family protein [Deinococcus taeanensis]|uniref:CapA family protein n=1 Tax=Deinococcus taeanensis TaxID=2737050 RepID=UPI001CDC3EBB|nr:CapA family protein [Deinococcus taeanensis]UBV42237.1 CapA family protein [Deinococcus taeanensis]